ncbi:hypothetical protein AQY21_13620 [Paracoccus sp. MKU1]|nr:hypothetical protein AQY21_13620 [Paracoccus sp. MKU1]
MANRANLGAALVAGHVHAQWHHGGAAGWGAAFGSTAGTAQMTLSTSTVGLTLAQVLSGSATELSGM